MTGLRETKGRTCLWLLIIVGIAFFELSRWLLSWVPSTLSRHSGIIKVRRFNDGFGFFRAFLILLHSRVLPITNHLWSCKLVGRLFLRGIDVESIHSHDLIRRRFWVEELLSLESRRHLKKRNLPSISRDILGLSLLLDRINLRLLSLLPKHVTAFFSWLISVLDLFNNLLLLGSIHQHVNSSSLLA